MASISIRARAGQGHEALLALSLALVFGGAWQLIAPRTADFAAQVYRVGLFQREGFALWDNAWFAGHHLPGYSVLFPAIGSLLGTRLAGLVAVAASAVLFADLARRHLGPRPIWPVAWFALAVVGDLYIGRLTFALGVTAALGCLVAWSRGRYGLSTILAAATAAASPVAGLFLGLAIVAIWPSMNREQRLRLAIVLGASVAAMAVMFPEGGYQPFDLGPALLGIALVLAIRYQLAPSERMLRRGAALYALALVAAYVVPTPMGSNAVRLGVLVGGPLLIAARRRVGPAWTVATCVVIALWQAWGPITEVVKAGNTHATNGAYFKPLVDELDRVGAARGRVEVVPTTTRWESVYVARRFALARGWETQLDRAYNGLFYRDPLRPAAYHRWLLNTGVRFVALADAPKERWGRSEERLIQGGLPFLRPVWRGDHWQVFSVAGARGLATASEQVTLSPSGFVLRARTAGVVTVRVRWTPYWSVSPSACVQRSPDGFTQLKAPAAGTYTVEAKWSLDAALDGSGDCTRTAASP